MAELDLADYPEHRVSWDLDEAESGVEAWRAFAAEHGAPFEVPGDVWKLVESMRARRAPSGLGRDMVMRRLAVLTNQALRQAGREERIERLVEVATKPVEGEPRWLLVRPADRVRLEREAGCRFQISPGRALLYNLASLPLTIAIFVLAYRGLTRERTEYVVAAVACYLAWLVVRMWVRRKMR